MPNVRVSSRDRIYIKENILWVESDQTIDQGWIRPWSDPTFGTI